MELSVLNHVNYLEVGDHYNLQGFRTSLMTFRIQDLG